MENIFSFEEEKSMPHVRIDHFLSVSIINELTIMLYRLKLAQIAFSLSWWKQIHFTHGKGKLKIAVPFTPSTPPCPQLFESLFNVFKCIFLSFWSSAETV